MNHPLQHAWLDEFKNYGLLQLLVFGQGCFTQLNSLSSNTKSRRELLRRTVTAHAAYRCIGQEKFAFSPEYHHVNQTGRGL